MTIKGVDVAAFQGEPGSWKAAAGDIDWAGVKLTELQPGGVKYTNPDAGDDWAWLRLNKKGRIAYLFGHPNTSPANTVDFFISELDKVGLDDGDAVALDLETTDGLAPAKVAEWGVTVLADLKNRLGRKPLLYTFPAFAEEGHCAGQGAYPLWISDPNHEAGKPTVPGPWKSWAIHQYGTSGSIDRDVADYNTIAAMQAAIGKPAPKPPTPTGDDTPMKFISRLTLDGPQTLAVGKGTLLLKWKATGKDANLLAKGSDTGQLLGDGVVLSIVQVRLGMGVSTRFVITAKDAAGKTQGELARDYDYNGGWVDFLMPIGCVEGLTYEIGLVNNGTAPLQVGQGTWEVIA